MTEKNRVLRSINAEGETRCVDIFQRPDGSFGFEEFRRDSEDNRGWFPIGRHDRTRFSSADDALTAARSRVVWLKDAMSGQEAEF